MARVRVRVRVGVVPLDFGPNQSKSQTSSTTN